MVRVFVGDLNGNESRNELITTMLFVLAQLRDDHQPDVGLPSSRPRPFLPSCTLYSIVSGANRLLTCDAKDTYPADHQTLWAKAIKTGIDNESAAVIKGTPPGLYQLFLPRLS